MLKKISILIFLTIFLSGCGNVKTQEEIVFSSWGSITETRILEKLIKDFEKENPYIKIKFMHIPQNYFQKIHLLFASNTSPDVLFINNLYLPVYENKLLDLSNEFEQEEFFPQTIEGLSYNKKILAIPRDISNLVFYVNTDKVALDKTILDLDELILYAQKATKDGVYGLSHEKGIYWALPYLRTFGGGLLNEKLEEIISSNESVEGIDFYNSLVKKYNVSPSDSQVGSLTQAQMFLNGKIVFYLSGRWMYPIISEKANFNWKIIPFPEGKLPQVYDTSGWAISNQAKHKDSSIKFVKFLASEKSSKYFTQTGLIVPARIDVAKMLDNTLHNEKTFVEVIKSSVKNPVNKNYRKLVDTANLLVE